MLISPFDSPLYRYLVEADGDFLDLWENPEKSCEGIVGDWKVCETNLERLPGNMYFAGPDYVKMGAGRTIHLMKGKRVVATRVAREANPIERMFGLTTEGKISKYRADLVRMARIRAKFRG